MLIFYLEPPHQPNPQDDNNPPCDLGGSHMATEKQGRPKNTEHRLQIKDNARLNRSDAR